MGVCFIIALSLVLWLENARLRKENVFLKTSQIRAQRKLLVLNDKIDELGNGISAINNDMTNFLVNKYFQDESWFYNLFPRDKK